MREALKYILDAHLTSSSSNPLGFIQLQSSRFHSTSILSNNSRATLHQPLLLLLLSTTTTTTTITTHITHYHQLHHHAFHRWLYLSVPSLPWSPAKGPSSSAPQVNAMGNSLDMNLTTDRLNRFNHNPSHQLRQEQ